MLRAMVLLAGLVLVGCTGGGDTGGACACEPGAQGPAGQPGADGARGPQGPAGAEGPAGPQGDPGVPGPQGPAGDVGPAGPAGPSGPQGPSGPMGLPGPAGATGAQGPTGPTGATGAAGPKGDTGPAGAMGPAGATGAQGPQGASGAPILPGETYTVTSDTMAGLNASVAASSFCLPGDVVLSGSCEWVSPALNNVWVTTTHPLIATNQGWACGGYNQSGVGQTLRSYALCYATP